MRWLILIAVIVSSAGFAEEGAIVGAFGQVLGEPASGVLVELSSDDLGYAVYKFTPVGRIDDLENYFLKARKSDKVVISISASGSVSGIQQCRRRMETVVTVLREKYGPPEVDTENGSIFQKRGKSILIGCSYSSFYLSYSDDALSDELDRKKAQAEKKKLEKSGL